MGSIISSIVAGIFGPVTQGIVQWLNKKQDVDLEKFKVNGQVDLSLVQAHIQMIQAQQQLLIQGTHDAGMRFLQYAFGYPLAIYYGKIILVDKVLAMGSTDPLTGDIATYSLWIVGFLFLHSAISGWGRKT